MPEWSGPKIRGVNLREEDPRPYFLGWSECPTHVMAVSCNLPPMWLVVLWQLTDPEYRGSDTLSTACTFLCV